MQHPVITPQIDHLHIHCPKRHVAWSDPWRTKKKTSARNLRESWHDAQYTQHDPLRDIRVFAEKRGRWLRSEFLRPDSGVISETGPNSIQLYRGVKKMYAQQQ
jgi:hypothetical protein